MPVRASTIDMIEIEPVEDSAWIDEMKLMKIGPKSSVLNLDRFVIRWVEGNLQLPMQI